MNIKDELLQGFSEWITFVERIKDLNWNESIGEGKWTIHDIVTHIYLWDKYFLEEAICPISNDMPLTLRHIDFDEFNQKARGIGKTQTKEEIIEHTFYYRNAIISEINSHDISKFTKEYSDGDGNKFIVEAYLKDFIWHDQHHMKQIKEFVGLM